jgi:RNA polymerase sigma-70 factor (ECF subfamily)
VVLAKTVASPIESPVRAVDFIGRLAALDADAWQAMFAEHYQKLYRFAYARTGDPSASEEIASEVFAAAVQRIGAYRETGAPIGAWLFRIARNQVADHLERRRSKPVVPLDGVDVETREWAASLEDKADLARSLRELTREQQDVIALRFFADCSLVETAASMNKSLAAVKVLQHRALAALRKQMGDRTR